MANEYHGSGSLFSRIASSFGPIEEVACKVVDISCRFGEGNHRVISISEYPGFWECCRQKISKPKLPVLCPSPVFIATEPMNSEDAFEKLGIL